MATEYTYLTDRQMQHIRHAPGAVRIAHDSLGTRSVREFLPMTQRGRAVYADVRTGTLYDATTGECLSTRQMRLVLDAPVKVTRKRKDLSAQGYDGWLNNARRAA